MKTGKELRQESRELLKGHWGKSIMLNIVPIVSTMFLFVLLDLLVVFLYVLVTSPEVQHGFTRVLSENAESAAASDGRSGASVGSSVSSIFGTLLTVGVMFTTIDWLRTKNADFKTANGIFAVFCRKYFVGTLVLVILVQIFTFLWSLCLVIPGIVKSYSYSQAYYIYKDVTDSGQDGNLNYLDCITLSRRLMKGNKLKYFCMQLGFAGWFLLAAVTPFGLGFIWYWPYYTTTKAAFYDNLSDGIFLGERAGEMLGK